MTEECSVKVSILPVVWIYYTEDAGKPPAIQRRRHDLEDILREDIRINRVDFAYVEVAFVVNPVTGTRIELGSTCTTPEEEWYIDPTLLNEQEYKNAFPQYQEVAADMFASSKATHMLLPKGVTSTAGVYYGPHYPRVKVYRRPRLP